MNKKGQGSFISLFIFIIMALSIVLISVVFIFIGDETETRLKASLGGRDFGGANTTNETIDQTIGAVNDSYQALYWISIFLIIAMMIGILVGSFLVTTHPLFIIAHIFGVAIAVLVGAGISNAYETIMTTPRLADIFAGMTGANEIMLHLPIVLAILGFAGAIIMFARLGKRKEISYG